MHLRYVTLLVASSMAVTSFAESAKKANRTYIPLAPPPPTPDHADHPINGEDIRTQFQSTDEEKVLRTTIKLDAFPFYKALHSDVALSINNIKRALDRKKWYIEGRDPIKQYRKLKLHHVPDELLLENLHWKNWAVFVCQQNNYNDPAKVIVHFMEKLMDDKRLLTMLVKEINHSPTTSLAEPLMAAKQQQWLDKGFTPDKVFTSLGLDQDAQSLFNNALYPTWFEFVQAYKMKHLDSKLTEVGCLKKIFKTDTNLLTVLTSANNMWSQTGQKVFKQLFEEQSDSAKFFDALMHSWSGLRAYYTKNKLYDDIQQEEIMKHIGPESRVDLESMWKLRDFITANTNGYPKAEDVLRVVLEENDPILTVWLNYIEQYAVRLPVTEPVVKTFEVLTSKDNGAKFSQTIVRFFVNDWVQKSVEPSKVYKVLLFDKGQDAKESQEAWVTFIHEFQKKNMFRLPKKVEFPPYETNKVAIYKTNKLEIPENKSYKSQDADELQDTWKTHVYEYLKKRIFRQSENSEISPHEMKGVSSSEINELKISEMINTFKELSAKLNKREPADGITMRIIVLDCLKNQPEPEHVLKMLLLDAGATRLLDHWVDFIGEYLEKMTIANLNELISLPDKDPTYVNMLSMLSAVRDLGHLPSRMIMSQHELKWLDLNLSPTNVFKILKLDKVIREMLEEVNTSKKEAAENLAEMASTSVLPTVSSFRPVQASVKPSVKDGSPLLDEDVSTLVDTALSELLSNPLLAVFLDFEKHYNGRHKTNETLLTTLLATYGEKLVAKLLNAVKELSQPVQYLQKELFKHYVETDTRPDDVLMLLGIRDKRAGARLWEAYDLVFSGLT